MKKFNAERAKSAKPLKKFIENRLKYPETAKTDEKIHRLSEIIDKPMKKFIGCRARREETDEFIHHMML